MNTYLLRRNWIFIVLAATLSSVEHIPVAAIALILGVDRFMSEARALTNLIGNGVATVVVARWEGELDMFRMHAELDGRDYIAKRDPRVAIVVSDPGNPSRYFQVRGRVVTITTDGAANHIEMLAQKYLGAPYPWFGGRDQVRVIITIEAEKVSGMGG